MSYFKLASRSAALAMVLGAGFVASPASAQGFFDQLFGGGSSQPAQQSFGYQSQQPAGDNLNLEPLRPSRPKKIAVHVDPLPQRQKTTDLWHDKTLHPGDAIMMKDGLHVYSGPEAAKHTAKQFVPLDRAHVAVKSRLALIAMDTTRNDPLKDRKTSTDTLASGRSAAVATPIITAGVRITDARGASVRYVGP